MTVQAETLATLTRIFREVFRNPEIALDAQSTGQSIAGFDSFKFVEIILALEREYGIELEGPEIDDVRNVGDLARVVETKRAEVA